MGGGRLAAGRPRAENTDCSLSAAFCFYLSGVIWPDLLSPQLLVALAVSIRISASAGDVKLNHLHKIRLKTSSKSTETSLSGERAVV